MVRLQPGQKVKLSHKDKWLLARVDLVDSSLVRMSYESDGKSTHEWLYRGSLRLEPLYKELVRDSLPTPISSVTCNLLAVLVIMQSNLVFI